MKNIYNHDIIHQVNLRIIIMELLGGLSPELHNLRWLLRMPHNTQQKFVEIYGPRYGVKPDYKFGAGCAKKAFWAQEYLGGQILFDYERVHFANLLPDGRVIDPSVGMISPVINGTVRTLDPDISIGVEFSGRSGRYTLVPFTDYWQGAGFKMYVFDGEYPDALDLLASHCNPDYQTSFCWPFQRRLCEIHYSPEDNSMYYYESPEINSPRINSAAAYCNSTPEELVGYFRMGYQLVRDSFVY